tara:strand:+ start:2692 stop:2874 length:183 start_codon:yes stop_codon:yes gene_type:complete
MKIFLLVFLALTAMVATWAAVLMGVGAIWGDFAARVFFVITLISMASALISILFMGFEDK